MKTWRIVLPVASTLAFGCQLSKGEREAPRSAEPSQTATPIPKIVVLGDSLTAGYGLSADEAFPALLEWRVERESYRFEVVNAGVSGDTSASGLRRVDWALEGDVRILVLALGANDGLRGLPPDQMKANLSAILEKTRERGIKVLLAGMEAPPNYGLAYTRRFREVFSELAREHDLAFYPFLLKDVAGIEALNQPDGVHPNAAGARVMAENLWAHLEPMLR